jgi:hypothetical protein
MVNLRPLSSRQPQGVVVAQQVRNQWTTSPRLRCVSRKRRHSRSIRSLEVSRSMARPYVEPGESVIPGLLFAFQLPLVALVVIASIHWWSA